MPDLGLDIPDTQMGELQERNNLDFPLSQAQIDALSTGTIETDAEESVVGDSVFTIMEDEIIEINVELAETGG